MANTYKKVYLHIVFAVKNREALLDKSWRSELFSYMSGILKKRGHYPLAVNGHKDHVHLLFDYSLKELPAELVRELKKASNQLINEHYVSNNLFNWQSGYGIFSVGWKEKDQMIQYIVNQEQHHESRSFKDEYLALLNAFNIEYKDEYVFDFL